jgi:hypothetical protein
MDPLGLQTTVSVKGQTVTINVNLTFRFFHNRKYVRTPSKWMLDYAAAFAERMQDYWSGEYAGYKVNVQVNHRVHDTDNPEGSKNTHTWDVMFDDDVTSWPTGGLSGREGTLMPSPADSPKKKHGDVEVLSEEGWKSAKEAGKLEELEKRIRRERDVEAHEFGHLLGLPEGYEPYYDEKTKMQKSRPKPGRPKWDIMAGGGHRADVHLAMILRALKHSVGETVRDAADDWRKTPKSKWKKEKYTFPREQADKVWE